MVTNSTPTHNQKFTPAEVLFLWGNICNYFDWYILLKTIGMNGMCLNGVNDEIPTEITICFRRFHMKHLLPSETILLDYWTFATFVQPKNRQPQHFKNAIRFIYGFLWRWWFFHFFLVHSMFFFVLLCARFYANTHAFRM